MSSNRLFNESMNQIPAEKPYIAAMNGISEYNAATDNTTHATIRNANKKYVMLLSSAYMTPQRRRENNDDDRNSQCKCIFL